MKEIQSNMAPEEIQGMIQDIIQKEKREVALPVSVQVKRSYRDRIFRMIFSDKKNLLDLYNAVNKTQYTNPEDLEITTLDHAIYMGMRNDVSFLIDSHLPLYEHQSTYNPNMPIRNFLYVASLYAGLTRNKNLYGSQLILLPTPKFVVFYNGIEDRPEMEEQRLSDAFEKKEEDPSLELKVTVLNINPGYNQELMKNCKTLHDYMCYVDKVRTYSKTMTLAEAVEMAITECIKDDVLADFLRKNRAEAKNVSIFEYDEEQHMRQVREEGIMEGEIKGKAENKVEIAKNLLDILDPATIAKKVGLSMETVLGLKTKA